MFSEVFQRLNDLWCHNKLNAKADIIQLSSSKLDIKILKNNVIEHTNFLCSLESIVFMLTCNLFIFIF